MVVVLQGWRIVACHTPLRSSPEVPVDEPQSSPWHLLLHFVSWQSFWRCDLRFLILFRVMTWTSFLWYQPIISTGLGNSLVAVSHWRRKQIARDFHPSSSARLSVCFAWPTVCKKDSLVHPSHTFTTDSFRLSLSS